MLQRQLCSADPHRHRSSYSKSKDQWVSGIGTIAPGPNVCFGSGNFAVQCHVRFSQEFDISDRERGG